MIRPATREDAIYVGEHMRAADAAEVWAATRQSPVDGALASFDASLACWAGVMDGEVICVFGYWAPTVLGEMGHPWLLTTLGVEKHWLSFLLRSRRVVQLLLDRFPVVAGVVDARYQTTIAWLRLLGFFVQAPQPLGHDGEPFCVYVLRR